MSKDKRPTNPDRLEIYSTIAGQVAIKNGDFVLTFDPPEARRAIEFLIDATDRADIIVSLLPKVPKKLDEAGRAAWLEKELDETGRAAWLEKELDKRLLPPQK